MVLSSTKVIDYLVCNTLGFAVVISKGQTHQLPHTTSSPQQRTNDVSLFSTANWKKKVKIPLRARRLGTFRLLMALAPRACHMVFFVSSTAFWNDAYLNWIPFCTIHTFELKANAHFVVAQCSKRNWLGSCTNSFYRCTFSTNELLLFLWNFEGSEWYWEMGIRHDCLDRKLPFKKR